MTHNDRSTSTKTKPVSESQIVEALLFSTERALTPKQISDIIGIRDSRRIRQIIQQLNGFYRDHNRPYFIGEVAGGYQLRTHPVYQQWIRKGRTVKPIRLSQGIMETLAIIAYQQPVTRAEIEKIRSVDSTYTLRTLLDKKLIRIAGRKEVIGRPLLYGTTQLFLEVFGFQTLADLPRPEDFDLADEGNDGLSPAEKDIEE